MSKFQGFPAYPWNDADCTFIPNDLLDGPNGFSSISTASELKVVLYILRHAHYEWRQMTNEEIGIGCGLSKQSVADGIRAAVEHGFIEIDEDRTDGGRIKKSYRFKDQTTNS